MMSLSVTICMKVVEWHYLVAPLFNFKRIYLLKNNFATLVWKLEKSLKCIQRKKKRFDLLTSTHTHQQPQNTDYSMKRQCWQLWTSFYYSYVNKKLKKKHDKTELLCFGRRICIQVLLVGHSTMNTLQSRRICHQHHGIILVSIWGCFEKVSTLNVSHISQNTHVVKIVLFFFVTILKHAELSRRQMQRINDPRGRCY